LRLERVSAGAVPDPDRGDHPAGGAVQPRRRPRDALGPDWSPRDRGDRPGWDPGDHPATVHGPRADPRCRQGLVNVPHPTTGDAVAEPVKLIALLKAKPVMSREEFGRRWIDGHAPLTLRFPNLKGYRINI